MKVLFEKVPRPSGQSFSCIEYRDQTFDCPYHRHPEIEILLIDRSTGKAVIGDSTKVFRPGQLYLFSGNLPHMFYNTPASRSRKTGAQSRYIQFLPNCLGEGFWSLPENRRVARLLRDSSRGILWEGTAAKRGAGHMDRVFEEHGARRVAELLNLLAFLAGNRSGSLLASSGYHPAPDEAANERIDRVLHYIHRDLAEKIELEKAARLAGLSVSGFGRFFRRSIGKSFMDYVIEQRISEARRLLVETDLTVTEICFQCGFANLSNFNRHFLSRCGGTPSSWRRATVLQNIESSRENLER